MGKIKKRPFLSNHEVLSIIEQHMNEKKPLSLIRIGDGENIVLAQKRVWPIRKVLRTKWARESRRSNQKGVRLPNIRLRNKMIRALRRATIVAIPRKHDKEIQASQRVLRPLTEKCFKKYKIKPKRVCHTFINRHLPEKQAFWEMLRGKKVILISKWAKKFRKYVKRNYRNYNIKIKPVRFSNFKQIKPVLRRVKRMKADLVLVSAGVSALILVDKLAHIQQRVAVDFGKSPMLILQKDRRVKPWKPPKKK